MLMAEYQPLIETYGYWLMAFGALIEGETFLLAGGIAASQGLLHLPGVILLAVVGSMIHDHFFYALGYFGGRKFLHRFKKWDEKSKKILALVDRYGVLVIIGFRFLYGVRTIIPAILGMSPIKFYRFFICDFIGGMLWAVVFVIGGFYFGKLLEKIYREIDYFESWLGWGLLGLILFVLLAGGFIFYKNRKNKNKNKNELIG